MAGCGIRSAKACGLAFLVLLSIGGTGALGQSMYKYRDADGSVTFSDRPPGDDQSVEIRHLATGGAPLSVTVTTQVADRRLRFVADNRYPIPVEVVLALDELRSVAPPEPEQPMRWIVDPHSILVMMELEVTAADVAPDADFRYVWIPGDPRARHEPERPYRAPFAVATDHPVSQAFPIGVTHTTPDAYYAVDFAMPIGTDIHAARGGVVFEVASTNFRGGTDPERDGASANLVRIMHDDGSHAVYAHLNRSTIRVRPGDRVERGEYIADSGNTGFSTGPHLHFAVMLNRGLRLESVPVTFEGADASAITPTTGQSLTAY